VIWNDLPQQFIDKTILSFRNPPVKRLLIHDRLFIDLFPLFSVTCVVRTWPAINVKL